MRPNFILTKVLPNYLIVVKCLTCKKRIAFPYIVWYLVSVYLWIVQ